MVRVCLLLALLTSPAFGQSPLLAGVDIHPTVIATETPSSKPVGALAAVVPPRPDRQFVLPSVKDSHGWREALIYATSRGLYVWGSVADYRSTKAADHRGGAIEGNPFLRQYGSYRPDLQKVIIGKIGLGVLSEAWYRFGPRKYRWVSHVIFAAGGAAGLAAKVNNDKYNRVGAE